MEEPGRELDVTSPFRELRCNTVLACNTPLVQIPFRLRCDSTQVRCPRCSSYARPCPPRACPSPWARHNIHATTVHVTTSTSPQPCPSGPPACSCHTQLPASRCALSECFDPGRSNLLENDHKDAHHESPEPLRSARHAALVVLECNALTSTESAADAAAQLALITDSAADAAAQPAAALALAAAVTATGAHDASFEPSCWINPALVLQL